MNEHVKAAVGSLLLSIGAAMAGDKLEANDLRPPIGQHDQLLKIPDAQDREVRWSAWVAQEWNGVAEHRLPDGSRVDVLLPDSAWEVEWPPQWAEAIGQAAWYSVASNRDGGIVLLMGRKPLKQEIIYLLRCIAAAQKCDITVVTIDVQKPEAKKPVLGCHVNQTR